MNRPWMPLYVPDYLGDTGHLSTLEHGAYMLLIMHYWMNDGVPDNDQQLARIARVTSREWRDMRDTLAALFQPGWRHKRVDAEIEEARGRYERRAKAGQKGGAAKAGGKQSTSNELALLEHRQPNAVATRATRQPQPQPQESNSSHPAIRPEPEPSAGWMAGLSPKFVNEVRSLVQAEPCRTDPDLAPIAVLLADGCTEADVLSGMAEALRKATDAVHHWSYFAGFVRIARDNRLAGPRKPSGAKPATSTVRPGPKIALKAGLQIPESEVRRAAMVGPWPGKLYGPAIGEPGCLVPPKLAAELLAARSSTQENEHA